MRKVLVSILILILCVSTGCQTIRKKFVRKKTSKSKPSVYVDFKEYPTTISQEDYINYYLFVRGWLDDLEEALRKGLSFKRAKRAVNEAVMNFEQMFYYYNKDVKEKVSPLYKNMLAIKDKVEGIQSMNETKINSLVKEISILKRKFESTCKFSNIEKWMS